MLFPAKLSILYKSSKSPLPSPHSPGFPNTHKTALLSSWSSISITSTGARDGTFKLIQNPNSLTILASLFLHKLMCLSYSFLLFFWRFKLQIYLMLLIFAWFAEFNGFWCRCLEFHDLSYLGCYYLPINFDAENRICLGFL